MRIAASAAPSAAGTAEAVNMNGREETRRYSITSAGPAITPPHEASDFENVAIRRSTRSSTPSSSVGARAARAEDAERVRLVDHQARAVAVAELGDLGQRRHVALHREHAVDDHEHAAAVAGRLLERVLEAVDAVVAERAQLGPGEDAAVEDRRVIAGVDHHRVARAEDRPEGAEVGLVAGGEDQRSLGAEPVGQLLLELEVQVGGPVQEARSGQARAVAVERLERALFDAFVAGQAQVVVRARA